MTTSTNSPAAKPARWTSQALRTPLEMRLTHPAHPERAALLAEVLIALSLLIIVIVMVAGLFPYSFSVDRKAWNQRTAQSVARSALEEARGQEFEELATFERTVVKDNTRFDAVVTVTSVGGADAREKTVVCKVSWPRQNGTDTLTLATTVAKLHQDLND